MIALLPNTTYFLARIRSWQSNMSLDRLNKRLVCLNSTTENASDDKWNKNSQIVSFSMSERCGWSAVCSTHI